MASGWSTVVFFHALGTYTQGILRSLLEGN
jgi:hypothetical protein